MPKKILLTAWVAGILFPMAWFSQQIPGVDQWFNRIFAPQWMHVAMHALLYSLLAAGIILAWPHSTARQVFAAALLVGVIQEILQPLPAGRFLGPGALFDLGIDLAGTAAGIFLTRRFRSLFLNRRNATERNV